MTLRFSSPASLRSALLAAALTVAASAGLNVGSSMAGSSSGTSVLRPFAGLSMEIGDKRAVGYFVADSGMCHVTLLVGEAVPEAVSTAAGTVPARFSASVAAGRSARVDTGTGPSLELTCSPGADRLTARIVERVAYIRPASRS